ncbi:MAG TPA: hypothetical protein VMM12_18985 [Longimicrobiales bacterium]|nr:hypothetical protein [Longimicrobiales bacterium]
MNRLQEADPMAGTLKANGEEWEVRLSRERPHEGVRVVVFRCVSNSSHGWRVVEVREGDYESQERLDELSAAELQALFERSQPFDYVHDPKAYPDAIGDPPAR